MLYTHSTGTQRQIEIDTRPHTHTHSHRNANSSYSSLNRLWVKSNYAISVLVMLNLSRLTKNTKNCFAIECRCWVVDGVWYAPNTNTCMFVYEMWYWFNIIECCSSSLFKHTHFSSVCLGLCVCALASVSSWLLLLDTIVSQCIHSLCSVPLLTHMLYTWSCRPAYWMFTCLLTK